MATAPPGRPAVTLDASFIVAYCTREPGRFATAEAELKRLAGAGYSLYAPEVVVSEVLFVICRKTEKGELTGPEAVQAVNSFAALMGAVQPPPGGDKALIADAVRIRGSYTCLRVSDSLYLALAEQLAALGCPELLTFDKDLRSHAAANAPGVTVRLFSP